MSFCSLGLCDELLKAVSEQGYTMPSPIQVEAIPAVFKQRDMMAVAQTGTGKTAGFSLPMVQLLSEGERPQPHCVRALVITPTRELAAQVAKSVENYSRHMNLRSGAVFGGVRIEPQVSFLKDGIDVLVATPGRLVDLYNQKAINFDQLEILVLDEADRMLDLGFIDDIRHIKNLLPSKRQTLMFSATFSQEIKSLASSLLNNPLLIEVTAANSTVDKIKQKIYSVEKARKSELLIHLIKHNQWHQVLVFSRTKHGADNLVSELEKAGITAASIHANRTQHARTLALEGFKNEDIAVLVATDIASRGIDVNQLPYVVNFDLPYVPEDYVHRIGRTGRAGKLGLAVSLFSMDESKQLQAIERLIERKFELETIAGFKPNKKAIAQAVAKEKHKNSNTQNRGKSKGNKPVDDEYGNFEADPEPRGRGKSKGRKKLRR
ncbi:DEAD/DEAH box helicase [Pseudoalteromonas denitrificans]|uniref:DEAD-box ATP-dependent RNA helicase RhpA n=1 Tax=Pseudoalteromonas denitrificans DSM 6059 TaxID=1123010 RepID=A0A1I1KH05_9GAMM|nr:DEAD/DEAH box helicase [Pseudoalteromonas denitrificans]SFC56750.1 ATP-dependent RNA helicase RhlE [Pseudoalteromonas denitrificans DSM 6059]